MCLLFASDKHVQVFEQFSPVGASRVVAGANDVDEHVLRATAVDAMPSRDLWSVLQNDVVRAIRIVASSCGSPEALLKKRVVMESIIAWAVKVLEPLNIRLRAMAPAHVFRLPTTINVPWWPRFVRQWSGLTSFFLQSFFLGRPLLATFRHPM